MKLPTKRTSSNQKSSQSRSTYLWWFRRSLSTILTKKSRTCWTISWQKRILRRGSQSSWTTQHSATMRKCWQRIVLKSWKISSMMRKFTTCSWAWTVTWRRRTSILRWAIKSPARCSISYKSRYTSYRRSRWPTKRTTSRTFWCSRTNSRQRRIT